MRALLVLACSGCTSVLGISDPKPATGDGGPDTLIDSNIDAPPPCTTALALMPEVTSDLGKAGTGFEIGRFNNGLEEDIVVATGADATILHGNRTGAFGADGEVHVVPTAAGSVVVEDYDVINSSDDDFAFFTAGGTSVIIRRQNRANDPPVEAEQPIGGFTNVQRVLAEQFDGNAQADLLIYEAAAGGRVFLSSALTPGSFTAGATVGAAGDEPILVRQIDGASRADALFVNGNTVKLSLQTAAGFGALTAITNMAASRGIAVGNFDGDTLVDLVVSTSMGLALFRQTSPGTFQMHGVISPLQSATPMLVGDLNGDGRDDLVLSNAVILQCAPPAAGAPGVFTQVEAISAAPPAQLVDVTGDGKLDLVRLEGNSIKVRIQ